MPLPRARGHGGGDNPFNPDIVTQLKPEAWYRFGVGITVTGAGASIWHDVSGNSPAGERDLLQGTDADRPTLQADGSLIGDGISQFMKTAAFTFVQPETIYFLGRQITFTDNDTIFDGDVTSSGRLIQSNPEPGLSFEAGIQMAASTEWTTGVYAPLAVVINGASSSTRVGNNAAVTGNAGASNMGAFTLFRPGGLALLFGHAQVKEIILFSGAHDTATQSRVLNYLSSMI